MSPSPSRPTSTASRTASYGRQTPHQLRPPPLSSHPGGRRAGCTRQGSKGGTAEKGASFPFPVVHVPAVPLPGYPSFRLGLPSRQVRAALIRHRTEVVHLAGPVFLGAHGATVARRLGLPTVAMYETDLPSYARAYRFGRQARRSPGGRCAASTTRRAHAAPRPGHRDQPARPGHRRRLAVGPRRGRAALPPGQAQPRAACGAAGSLRGQAALIVGYVGRLATEKRVELLAGITALAGSGWSSSSGRADRAVLRQRSAGRHLPRRAPDEELADIYASLDVFVQQDRMRRSADAAGGGRERAAMVARPPEGRSTW